MGKARGSYRPLRFLVVITVVAISACFAFAQDTASNCSLPKAEISNISRPTGVLRADPNANETAGKKIASDAAVACRDLSDPAALVHVRMKISDNNIIVSGAIPTEADREQIIAIISANADGRAVFNRLEVVPIQMARKQ